MQPTRLVRSMLVALTLASSAVALPACSKSADITAENIEDQGVLTEQHESASVVWAVSPEGQVKALVKGSDGKPIEKDVTGKVTAKAVVQDAAPVTAELKAEEKAGGVLAATIPKLEADLTEVSYEIKADGKPMKGVIHVGPGGTKELVANAKVTAEAKLDGKKGPNGGVLQVVGEDTLEIVADKNSGKVRVYLLDDDLKAVAIGDRKLKVKLAVSADTSDVVELVPGSGGAYFEGKLSVKVNPKKVTLVVVENDAPHVVLCGWYPDTVVVVGPSAPGVGIFVVANWDVDVKVSSPVVVVGDDDDDDDHVVVVGKGKGKGRGKYHYKRNKHGVSVKIH